MQSFLKKLNNNEELTNFDIEDILKFLNIPIVGIYRQNELPNRFFKPHSKGGYIINLDKDGGGTHWSAIYKKGKSVFYGDSYGNPMPDEIANKLSSNTKIYHSDIQREPINSNRCGWYCILFLIICDGSVKKFYDLNEIFLEYDESFEDYILKLFNILLNKERV